LHIVGQGSHQVRQPGLWQRAGGDADGAGVDRGGRGDGPEKLLAPTQQEAVSLMSAGFSMNRYSQTRMTNDEIRRNDQIRMTKPATAEHLDIRASDFFRHLSFVIRNSEGA